LTQVREDAVRQIVLADNALRTSLSAYSASRTLEAAARTTFDAALAAYRNGVGSITDLTLAETQLLAGEECVDGCLQHGAVGCRDARAFDGGAWRGPVVRRCGEGPDTYTATDSILRRPASVASASVMQGSDV